MTTLPIPKNEKYHVTFTDPALTMTVKRQYLPQLGRYMDFISSVCLPIQSDNSLDLSEYQFSRIVDIFASELESMIGDGFSRKSIGEQEIVIEHAPTSLDIEPVDDGLIPVMKANIGGDEVNAVDAKILYSFLNVKTPFNKWIDRRIKEYEFLINSDFQTFLSKSTGGRKATEYILSFDMAKELSMVENNAKGREARRYFIDCEKRLRAIEKAKINPSCQIQQQLEEAVRTKAAIGDKKVASALAKAGHLTKENKKLLIENQELKRRLTTVKL